MEWAKAEKKISGHSPHDVLAGTHEAAPEAIAKPVPNTSTSDNASRQREIRQMRAPSCAGVFATGARRRASI